MERMGRKEIFQHEIKTGATIEEIKIYTNSLSLIYSVFWSEKDFPENEKSELLEEIKDLKKKIKLYEKKVKKI